MNADLFAKRIHDTRRQRKMSLEQLAQASGFTKSHVWELEQGNARNPTVRAVWAIAEALGVSPAWLMGLDPDANALEPLAFRLAAIIREETSKAKGESA